MTRRVRLSRLPSPRGPRHWWPHRLGDGRRRRETIIVSLSLVTVGGVLTVVAPGFAVLLIGRALQGVGLW